MQSEIDITEFVMCKQWRCIESSKDSHNMSLDNAIFQDKIFSLI